MNIDEAEKLLKHLILPKYCLQGIIEDTGDNDFLYYQETSKYYNRQLEFYKKWALKILNDSV